MALKMLLLDMISDKARRFRDDRGGAAAVIFAITVLPMAFAIGAAIDYASAIRMRATLTGAQPPEERSSAGVPENVDTGSAFD